MKNNKEIKTKIFCDTADIKIIKQLSKKTLVNGFTTNPSLMKLSGAKDYKNYSKKIIKICKKKSISLEVIADDFIQMEKQAYKIKSWGSNVYVKIPVTNSKGYSSAKIIKRLSDNDLKLNITAVYTLKQVKKIIKCVNKNSHTIISIFSGRMSDVGKDPIPIIKQSVKITKKMKKIKILWASTREAYNYTQAIDCKCDIITMPPNIIEKISKFGKSFERLTLDTVKTFYKDALSANFRI
jgi:transaldolase|tara:strand:- start:36 stop:752 length:717 start_codon:yes stop_codon:yes gene_type:complete